MRTVKDHSYTEGGREREKESTPTYNGPNSNHKRSKAYLL